MDSLDPVHDHMRVKMFEVCITHQTHIPTNAGLVQPVKSIGDIYTRYEKAHPDETWYILDACQSAGQLSLDVQQLQCDFLSVTARKFLRGPRC
jgi:selenocysteine lyase/cysteine desulfurase